MKVNNNLTLYTVKAANVKLYYVMYVKNNYNKFDWNEFCRTRNDKNLKVTCLNCIFYLCFYMVNIIRSICCYYV